MRDSVASPVTIVDPSARMVFEALKASARDSLKTAVAARVNGVLRDLSHPVESDAQVQAVPANSPDGLDIIRHSCAHLVRHAVKQLYPTARMVIGPVIEDGFYYDIAFERPFTQEDLAAIEARMRELIAKHYPVLKHTVSREEAIAIFEGRGETYKLRLIEDMPDEATLGLYFHEDTWTCAAARTCPIRAFSSTSS